MLQNIHDKSKGWITYLIMGFLLIVFLLWGISYYLKGLSAPSQSVAEVDGQSISLNEFNRAYQSARSQIAGALGDAQTSVLKQKILTQLIDRKLRVQAAQKEGFGISDQTLNDWILSDLSFKDSSGQFSPERFQLLLQQLGITASMLQAQIRNDVLIKQVESGVTQSSFSLSDEISPFAQVIDPAFNVAMVKIPLSHFSAQPPSDEALQAYYQKHLKEFDAPAEVKIAYVELKTNDAYSAQFDQLANLAFEHPESLAPAAKALGLEIKTSGYFSQKGGEGIAHSPKVVQAAFSEEVMKNNNNSDLIKLSSTDVVVIRVLETQAPHHQAFSAVRAELLEDWTKESQESQANALIETLRSAKNLGQKAHELGLTFVPEKTYFESEKDLSPELKKAIFSSSETGKSQNYWAIVTPDNQEMIFLAVRPAVRSSKQSTALKEANLRLPALWGAWEYQNYEAQLIHDAKIERHL